MVTPSLLSIVVESQGQETEILSIKDRVQTSISDEGWVIHTDGSLQYRGRVMVPKLVDLREEILREFHCSRFVVHPSSTTMYHGLHRQYYWNRMKKHVGGFVHQCLTCQQVKVEH